MADIADDVPTSNSTLGHNESYMYYYYYYDDDYDTGEMQFYYVLWTITTPIVFALITVIGVIGNLFVVMVIMTHRSRRQSPTNILLLNLEPTRQDLHCRSWHASAHCRNNSARQVRESKAPAT